MRDCMERFGSVFTVLVAGDRLTIVTDPLDFAPAVFRNSKLNFAPIADSVSENAFGVSYVRLGLDQHWVDKSYRTHLQGAGLVPLTTGFLQHVPWALQQAEGTLKAESRTSSVPLYHLVLETVFSASSAALFGRSAATSALCSAFTQFDDQFPLLVAGLPAWLLPGVASARAALRGQFDDPDPSQHAMMHERDAKLAETVRASLAAGGDAGGAGAAARQAMQSEILWAAEANTIPAAFWSIARLLDDQSEGGAFELVRQEALEALGRALCRARADLERETQQSSGTQAQ